MHMTLIKPASSLLSSFGAKGETRTLTPYGAGT